MLDVALPSIDLIRIRALYLRDAEAVASEGKYFASKVRQWIGKFAIYDLEAAGGVVATYSKSNSNFGNLFAPGE